MMKGAFLNSGYWEVSFSAGRAKPLACERNGFSEPAQGFRTLNYYIYRAKMEYYDSMPGFTLSTNDTQCQRVARLPHGLYPKNG